MKPFCSSGGGGDQDNSAVNGEADEAMKFCGTPVGTVVMEKHNYIIIIPLEIDATTQNDFTSLCCCHIGIFSEWTQLDGECRYSIIVEIEGMKRSNVNVILHSMECPLSSCRNFYHFYHIIFNLFIHTWKRRWVPF